MMNKSTRNLTLIFIQIFSAYEVQKMGPFLWKSHTKAAWPTRQHPMNRLPVQQGPTLLTMN
jgi:hypothetical protein